MGLRRWKTWVFILTWIAYASTYLLRKSLGVVKAEIGRHLSLSRSELGFLDTAIFLPYATIQIFLGHLGDMYGPRRVLGFGLLISAASMASFGMWKSFIVLSVLLFINGSAQALAWPSCMKILSQWYTEEQRSAVFGLWGTCVFAGGIIGTSLAAHFQNKYGWSFAFSIPSIFVAIVSCVVLISLKSPSEAATDIGSNKELPKQFTKEEKLKFNQMLKIPMLPEVAIATFCVKVVRYCMYMWLPMYLNQAVGYENYFAGLFSITFEIGGVMGSSLLGFYIDRWCGASGQMLGTSLAIFFSALALLAFSWLASSDLALNVICMILAGAFNCGTDPILTGTVPTKLAERNGLNAQSSITGLINGFGSLGTVLEGPIVGYVADNYGWEKVFWLMISMSVVGALSLIKAHLHSQAEGNQKSVLLPR